MSVFQKKSLANKSEKSTKEKQTKLKNKRLGFLSKIKDINWRNKAREVCKEKLAHYEATGNTRKAAIYRSKLE